jgi:hypothetical protein
MKPINDFENKPFRYKKFPVEKEKNPKKFLFNPEMEAPTQMRIRDAEDSDTLSVDSDYNTYVSIIYEK